MGLSVSKPAILKRLDKLSRNQALVRRSLADLRKKRKASLVELGLVYGHVPAKGTDAAHLRDDWFDQGGGWWAGLGNVEATARKALIKAGQLVLRNKLPIDSYWVCGGDSIEFVVAKSDYQITFLIVSPSPPPRIPRPLKGARQGRQANISTFR